MKVELGNQLVSLSGDRNPIADALIETLQANGAMLAADPERLPDILVVSLPLLPTEGMAPEPLLRIATATGEAMQARGNGRIIFLLSAVAGMPMRRHPDFSREMAGVLTTVRTLAMRLGPEVLVNAVGVGAAGEPLIAGDTAMLGHASVKRPGLVSEVVDTALFFADPLNSYTTGQMLVVDGGWSAGYGRSF